jgi:hypothetical protein
MSAITMTLGIISLAAAFALCAAIALPGIVGPVVAFVFGGAP